MDLSVIIVSYKVKYFLALCLFSVKNAVRELKCEIFVVDNNSADGSCAMVRKEFPEVKLITNKENKGFSAANNQAIKIASGKYILLLNPDTIVGEDTFVRCIKFMDEHPDAGAAGVMMINGKGKYLPESKRAIPEPETAFYKISGLSYLFPRSARFNRYYMGHLDINKTNHTDVIAGAFMFMRTEAVLKTGLLDESFFMYGEDIDYSYRLLKAGYKNYYFPDVKILHFKGESTKKEEMDFVIHFYKAMLIFVKKHFNDGSLKKVILPVKIAILLRATASVIRRLTRKIVQPVRTGIVRFFPPRLLSLGKTATAVVSDTEGYERIKKLMPFTGSNTDINIRTIRDRENGTDNIQEIIREIEESVKSYRIRQVIFSPEQIKLSSVIYCMQILSHHKIRFKIASPGEKYLLGSGSVTGAAD